MNMPTTGKMGNLFNLEFPQLVGTFASYDQAQQAVDHLADQKFAVENLCIVGTDLRSVERVLGRRNWGTVLGQGVQSGLSTGLMVGLLMMLFYPAENVMVVFLAALLMGILIGVVFSAIGYWMSQGKRDFTSVSQTVATRYELLSEHKVAGQARELLAQLPSVRQAAFQSAPAAGHQAPGYPPPGNPAPGYPPAGYPAPGYPPAGYPQQGWPPGWGQQPPAPQQPVVPPAPPQATPTPPLDEQAKDAQQHPGQ